MMISFILNENIYLNLCSEKDETYFLTKNGFHKIVRKRVRQVQIKKPNFSRRFASSRHHGDLGGGYPWILKEVNEKTSEPLTDIF